VGYIPRQSLAGRLALALATAANLRLPFLLPIASANETTLTETDLARPLVVGGDAVRVELPAYGVKTIRVRRAAAACGKVKKLTASPVSDMEVALEWTPVPDVARLHAFCGHAVGEGGCQCVGQGDGLPPI
jgi:hypothetical protein